MGLAPCGPHVPGARPRIRRPRPWSDHRLLGVLLSAAGLASRGVRRARSATTARPCSSRKLRARGPSTCRRNANGRCCAWRAMPSNARAAAGCCISGGVALNGRTNHLVLEQTPIEHVWVPRCSDAGDAAWARAGALGRVPGHCRHARPPARPVWTTRTGRDVGDAEIADALAVAGVTARETTAAEVAARPQPTVRSWRGSTAPASTARAPSDTGACWPIPAATARRTTSIRPSNVARVPGRMPPACSKSTPASSSTCARPRRSC